MNIPFDGAGLAPLCQKYHVKELSLFGSVLRTDFTQDSDIDVLVEYDLDAAPGISHFAFMEELSEFFGERDVDLTVKKNLKPGYRQEILANREVVYVKPHFSV